MSARPGDYSPLEFVAAMHRLQRTNPAEYKRIRDEWDAAVIAAMNEPNPWLEILGKYATKKEPSDG